MATVVDVVAKFAYSPARLGKLKRNLAKLMLKRTTIVTFHFSGNDFIVNLIQLTQQSH